MLIRIGRLRQSATSYNETAALMVVMQLLKISTPRSCSGTAAYVCIVPGVKAKPVFVPQLYLPPARSTAASMICIIAGQQPLLLVFSLLIVEACQEGSRCRRGYGHAGDAVQFAARGCRKSVRRGEATS